MKGSKFQRQYDRSRDYLGQIKQLGPQRVLNSLYAVFPIAFEKPEIARKVSTLFANHDRTIDLYGLNLTRLHRRSQASKIALCCMPKSGSTFIQTSLQALPKANFQLAYLHSPYMNADFVGAHSREHEIDELALTITEIRGLNYVSQMHTKWSEYTEACFAAYGIKPIITYRNVFDCIVSLDDMLRQGKAEGFPMIRLPDNYRSIPDAERLAFLCLYVGPWYLDYIVSWSRAGLPLLRLDYDEDIKNFDQGTAEKIRDFLAIDGLSIEDFLTAFTLTDERRKDIRLNKGINGRGTAIPRAARDQLRALAAIYQPTVDFGKYLD